ncbi:MAG: hypothetical protein FWE37_00465 [Spirochaetaceae bacterium]|nr:hypothetical protein [Spirochaetaceae bacterium]
MKKLTLFFIIIGLTACTREPRTVRLDDFTPPESFTLQQPPPINEVSWSEPPVNLINWQLSHVFSSLNGEESAYLKQVGNQHTVFPFVWDRFPNIDRDPTEDETGIVVPINNYRAIWLDAISLPGYALPAIFLKLIAANGQQLAYVYRNIDNVAVEIFALESLGEINLSMVAGELFIDREETVATGLEVHRYGFSGSSFQLNSVFIRNESTLLNNPEARALRALDVRAQEAFLHGPWIRSELDSGSFLATNSGQVLVQFRPESREIVFGEHDMLEVFNWNFSTRLQTGLLLSTRNSQIDYITSNITIVYHSNNEILLRFNGDSPWRGTYRRMTASQMESTLPRSRSIELFPLQLNGSYFSASGSEWYFNATRFTLNEGANQRQGNYAVFRVNNQLILTLNFVNSRGITLEREAFLADFNERHEGGRTVRSLTLTPGELLVWGIEPAGVSPLFIEQIELTLTNN